MVAKGHEVFFEAMNILTWTVMIPMSVNVKHTWNYALQMGELWYVQYNFNQAVKTSKGFKRVSA